MKPNKKSILYIYLLFLMCLFSNYVSAQLSIQVVTSVLPPYSLNIADYRNTPERILIKLINTSNAAIDVQLGARFSSSNGVLIKTKDGFVSSSPINVPANSATDVDLLQIAQLFDLNSMDFEGFNRAEVFRTGILPEGDYQLCIRAYNYTTLEPISGEEPSGCSSLIPLYGLEPPVITNPISESTLPIINNQNVIFNWTTPPGSPPQVQYTFLMVEVQGNGNPNEALLANSMIPFYEQTLNQNMLIYGADKPALIKDKKYAVRVTADDPINNTVFRNNGNSEVIWFIYGEKDKEIVNPVVKNQDSLMSDGNCGANCAISIPGGNNGNANTVLGDRIFINEFTMTIIELEPKINGKLTGKGTIPVPFINASFAKLRVEFKDIDVNEGRHLIKGNIKAIVKQGSPSLEPVGQDEFAKTLNYTKQDIMRIMTFINNDPFQQVGEIANKIGFEVPLGISSDPFSLAITEVVFTPVDAYFSVATVVPIPENNDNLALTAAKICMDGSSSICGSMELYLAQDFNIDPINLKLIGMKNEGNKSTGTFMKLRKNDNNKVEVTHFHVKAEFVFPSKSLVNAATNTPLKTTFEFDAKNGWHDWKAELTVPEFYIDGVDDVKFDLAGKMATLDHSDTENPMGIPTPYKSSDNSEPDIRTDQKTWHGLYFPLVQVTIPDIVKSEADPNKNIKILGRDLIFTSHGFTGTVEAINIISLGDGSLAGWYASIDRLKLDFWKSTFKSSSLDGKLVLPPCGSDIGNKINQLDYKCLLTNPQDKPMMFQFSIVPKNDMQFKAFYAKVNINNTSQILIATRPKPNNPEKIEFFAKAKLDGLMGVTDDVKKIPGIVGLSIPDLIFTNFQILTDAPYINADEDGVFKFGSPQKKMAGFTYNLTDVKALFEPGAESKVGIKFKGNLNLIGEGSTPFSMAAQGSFGIFASVSYTNSRFSWEGIGARVDDISLGTNVDLGAMKLTGALKYYNIDNPSDCGFVGAIAVKLPSIDIGISMKAQFGVAGTGNTSFKYFNLEAMADFGKAGLPMFAGVNLYGLGGGVYYNMTASGILPETATLQNQKGNAMDAAIDKSPIELLNYSPSGQKYSPSIGSFAFSATALFGLVRRNTLDANANFFIGFNENGGIQLMSLTGECRVITDTGIPMPSRNLNTLLYGKLAVEYDFEDETFDLGIDAELKFPFATGSLLSVKGWLNFNVSPQGWYLHIGRPLSPAEINVMSIFKGETYFETGSYNIDPMPDIPQRIRDLAGDEGNKLPRLPQMPRGGAGFIHGAHTYFNVSGSFLILYGHLKAGMGYDISFKQYEDFVCANLPAAGSNGWYAMGQAYLGVSALIGMDFGDWFGKLEIFEGGAVAVIMAGLPNPSWAKGGVAGKYSVLNGLFDGTFNFKFEVGNVCVPTNSMGIDFTLVSDMTPGKKTPESELDIDITQIPSVAFNFNVDKGNFEYNAVTNNGESKVRYLKFDRSTIDISLVGGGENFGSEKFVVGSGKPNTLVFSHSNLLKPNTDYVFTVKAALKEAKSQGGNHEYITANGKRLEELWVYKFRTGKGLKSLTNTLYVHSYPLHSHKTYIDDGIDSKFYCQFTHNLTPMYFDTKSPETAKTYAIIYKNEIPVSEHLVVVDGYKWKFNKFALDQNTNYRVEFVFRQPKVEQVESRRAVNYKYADANIVNTKIGIAGYQLKGANSTIGYFKFRSSAYKTYAEKFENQTILDIVFTKSNASNQEQKIILALNKTPAENIAALDVLCSNLNEKGNPNFVYKINCPKNLSRLDGETFSRLDVMTYSTHSLFNNDSIRPDFSPTMDVKYEYDHNLHVNKFIAKVTGLIPTQFEAKIQGIILGPCGDQETTLYSYPVTSSAGSTNNLPYATQVDLFTLNKGGSGSTKNNSNANGIGQLGFMQNLKTSFEVLNVTIGCSGRDNYPILNSLQNFNSIINPAAIFNANNINTWLAFNGGIKALDQTSAFTANNVKLLGFKSFN